MNTYILYKILDTMALLKWKKNIKNVNENFRKKIKKYNEHNMCIHDFGCSCIYQCKCVFVCNCSYDYCVKKSGDFGRRRPFNFRDLNEWEHEPYIDEFISRIINTRNFPDDIKLPEKYFYSSGMNSLEGWKNI